MFVHEVKGVTVRAEHYLTDYMPALAEAILRQNGVSSIFVRDLVKHARGSVHETFPDNLSPMGRGMRVIRLLAAPVEVGGVVMRIESLPKRRMREKTKKVFFERTTLENFLAARPDLRATSERPLAPEYPPQDFDHRYATTVEDRMYARPLVPPRPEQFVGYQPVPIAPDYAEIERRILAQINPRLLQQDMRINQHRVWLDKLRGVKFDVPPESSRHVEEDDEPLETDPEAS